LGAVAPPVKADVPKTMTEPYKCRLAVIHPGIPEGFKEFLFTVAEQGSEVHGGKPLEFKAGNQTVILLADGKWLAISWWIDEKLVAESVTVVGSFTKEPRALIVYDPADHENNQVALDCKYEPEIKP
jgi:hypothetical protein